MNDFSIEKHYCFFIFAILVSGNLVANGNKEKSALAEKEITQLAQNLRGNGLCFTQNNGQVSDMNEKSCPDVLYKGEGGYADVYLRKTGISYVHSNIGQIIYDVEVQVEDLIRIGAIAESDEQEKKQELLQKNAVIIQRLDMDFAGCLPDSSANKNTINEDPVEGYTNYYKARYPQGITRVHQYNKVTCKNIYNNIDVTYFGSAAKGMKYDIVVNVNGDPGQIKLRWSGADKMHIDREGNLVIKTSINEFIESIPKVYQKINGEIVNVKARYVLNESTVSFELGNWDRKFPLIIDPFIWATYYGGSGFTAGSNSNGIVTDPSGNVLIAGGTIAVNFPVTAGAFQTNYKGGNSDAFIVKFDSNGIRLWATYYGGSMNEAANGITATDVSGNIAVAGNTRSTDLPISALAFQTGIIGTSAAFITMFSPAGSMLWSTYYGGVSATAIASDAGGSLVITGQVSSAAFLTMGSYTANGDAIVVKFNSSGLRLWATCFGGTNGDSGNSIAIDKATGDIGISGSTNSVNLPVSGAFQTAIKGTNDYFVARFTSVGVLLWATYYGGSVNEFYRSAIAIDGAGNVVMTGNTESPDLFTSPGAFQTIYGGGLGVPNSGGDFFVVKFNPTGGLLWATYLGGSNDELFVSITIDTYNNIYIFGEWEDKDNGTFPMNTCALQKTFGGGTEDFFVTKFDAAGHRLCSTFIGGTGEDENDSGGGAITTYGNFVYITAGNLKGGFPVTPGAFQTNNNTFLQAANVPIVAKFCSNSCGENNPVSVDFTNSPISLCSNAPVQFNATINSTLTCDTVRYKWIFAGATPGSSTQQNPSSIVYATPGTYDVILVASATCGNDTLRKSIAVSNCTTCNLSAQANTINNVTCNGAGNGSAAVTVVSGAGGPYTYGWSNGQTVQTATGLVQGSYTVTVSDAGSCTATAVVSLTAPLALTGQFAKGAASCVGCSCKQWIMVNATGGTSPYSYSWPDGYVNRYKNQLCPGAYTINVKDKNGCSINLNVSAP